MDRYRILIAPRPGLKNGPGIALLRLERALHALGHRTTSLPFRLFGYPVLPWRFAIMMGVPAHAGRLFGGQRPVVLIMGKPEDPVESAAVGRAFTAQDAADNERRAQAIERADRVTFISHYVAAIWQRWFAERGRALPKYEVVYHGLDLERFKPGVRGKGGVFTIGCVGAFRTLVRVNTIYEVSRRLSIPHRFVIVGSATEECERQFEKLRGCNGNTPLRRIPWVSADQLAELLQSIDCLLHPVDYEGFGIVIAEAMACGVPVVAPAQGGAAEIVPPGGVAVPTEQFRYDQSFFQSLADGIETVIRDHQNFASEARRTAVERFDIRAIAERFVQIGEQGR